MRDNRDVNMLWLLLLAAVAAEIPAAAGQVLTPPYFNLAEGRRITASATCGIDVTQPELYCKLVGAHADQKDNPNVNLIQGQVCDYCDPSNPELSHGPENAIDGTERWWQSPPLSRGNAYNEVNLTIDLGQVFHVAYVFIKMANSPRPGIWALERSTNHGETWEPWQYFADTPGDCVNNFGVESLEPPTKDDSVVCETEFSKVVPLEGGEIVVSLLNDRPSANNFYNSTVLQEWTKATSIRLRLIRTKTLLGHLMSVARQDPTVTRRYFYSIRDISVGGRCVCNGHADLCDITDPEDPYKLLCRCQHNTCGAQCEQCCPGFVQKKWRSATYYSVHECEPCNCFGHADECIYDEETDQLGLSLDIHGRYEGGGVCQNCQDNTEGINCNRCKPGYYRPYGRALNETDVCQSCQCDLFFSTGSCAEGSGQCECRIEFLPPLCDQCNVGYFGYPNCRPCDCHLNGTRGLVCEVGGGQCPCKSNYAGKNCDSCAEGFYNFPECLPCECNLQGAVSTTCEAVTGQCNCKTNYGSRTCSQCDNGYSSYPICQYCNCDRTGCVEEVCDKESGQCLCRKGYGGPRCDVCAPGYYGYPNCRECGCNEHGSISNTCDDTGKCQCLNNFAGLSCSQCSPGYYRFPDCLACNCDPAGAIGISCDDDGRCQCRANFDGTTCNSCRQGYYNYPACEECNCDPAGVLATFAGCGSLTTGELCQCKERVTGRVCNQCRPLYWNLLASNPLGCEDCKCHIPGTLGGINVCDGSSGQCFCKPNTASRQCDQCRDGTYNMQGDNLFGCTDCGCDVGGAVSQNCDKTSGQCACRPRISGRTCNEPLQLHYFPTVFQHQYEVEDGHTPSYTPVRYGYNQHDFANYSWRGYATFSPVQKEILLDVYVEKPSLYRVVMYYVNRAHEAVVGDIVFTPEASGDIQQSSKIRFDSTSQPQFLTVSGADGISPSHFVLNPGRWTISIVAEKPLLLDYIVLLPSAYYEATILQEHVQTPCKLGVEFGSCRHYAYPELNDFTIVRGEIGYVAADDERIPAQLYSSSELSEQLGNIGDMAYLNEDEREIQLDMFLPKSGRYVLVLLYFTPSGGHTATIHVETSSTSGRDKGHAVLYDCMFTTLCRQAVTDPSGRVAVFHFDNNFITLHLKGLEDISVLIHSVVAIPVKQWNTDFVRPRPACVRQDGKCIDATFHIIPGTTKVECEVGNENRKTNQLPSNIFDENSGLVYLDHKDAMVDIRGKVPQVGAYVFVVHYYQPRHPEFDLDVLIQNGQFYEAVLAVPFCPSASGCRALVKTKDGETKFQILENFLITLKEPNHKSVWLDYILAIPASDYKAEVLEEVPLDRAIDFITLCGSNQFHMESASSGFCRDATFSLTSEYNNGGLPCHCDFDGSISFECEKFGGQCPCKPNIIGRQCSECRTGYYGFPDCQPCNCPSTAVCHPTTGACICPPKVTGEKCETCLPNTYGFDPIIGCEECNCNPLGVQKGNLQCDILIGQCSCKPNLVGRTCDKCQAGYWAFPFCQLCDCDLRGTTEDICDQDNARCFCKENVYGPTCDQCKPGTFHLEEKSPVGCTKCFCFGKIDRCSSSTMYKIQVAETEGWSAVLLESGTANAVEQDNDIDLDGLNLQLSQDIPENTVTYFSAPNAFLGNKITSYGGQLYYIITYIQDRAISGSSIVVPDVILMGNNLTIVYENIEQPVAGEELKVELDILEQNFHHLSGGPITREQLMMALYSLEKLYIRAQYYTDAVEARLNQVLLDTATSQYVGDAAQALSVEQCHCPPNYQGSSCEDCSPGYYRSQTGPFGGYCIPCQCNGHADTCDSLTGRCIDCKHNTTGDHCEKCLGGFHGDATIGTPYDCLICACPLPTMSNNFAVSCEFSPSGLEIKCDCKPGYYGPRCNYCAAGFYGRPEVPGEICKPCECSGNIDPSSFASCDSTTGDCLECLNNTSGAACELCSPGFFGDAISFKNCRKCSCDECGTRECHHSSGICSCMPNVIGDKCEECSPGHYGFDSCRGCVACDCGTASESSQCDLNTGQCKCRPGVTGRTCDRCLPGHWNYGVHGCRACSCNQDYSIGGSCNPETGQCECLPGVIGEKCDHCPYRWVLIPNVGCKECGTCVHVLLDDVDHLRGTLGPVLGELEGVSLSFFAYQRLNGINKTVDDLRPFVDALIYDPSSIDLLPVSLDVKSLERQSKQLDKKGNVSTELAAETSSEADKTRQDALALEKEIQDIAHESLAIVDEIQELSYGIVEAAGPNVDRQIAEAERILAEIQRRDFDTPRYNAEAEDEYANDTLAKAKAFAHPLELTSERVDELKDRLKDLEDKLRELLNYTITALQQIHDTKDLNDKNKVSGAVPKIALIEELGQNSQKHLTEGRKLIEDARKLLEDAKNNFEDLGLEAERLRQSTDHLRGKVETLENELDEVKPVVREAEQHAEGLMEQANDLDNLLADTRESADNAVKAANSYSDIVDAIKEALKAAEDAVEAANQAQNMSEGMDDKAQESKDRSQELLEEAKRARARVDPDLANHLANAKKGIDLVEEMNKLTEDGLEELNRGMDRLPIHALGPVAATAVKTSNGANNKALDALGKTEWITDRLPDDIARSEQIPKDIDEANKGIKRAHNQVEKMAGVVPEISRLMDRLGNRTKVVRVLGVDVGDKIAELKRKVALAQDQANRIKLGVHFDNDVTLQIRNPDGLNQLATYNKMSLYFKTNKKNGFLAYLGNELETHKHMRRAVSDDYMSLVIDNGYVVLIMDMGHGFRRIANSRVVDDNQWHQVIVERIGKSATVIVRTEDEEDAVTTADLPGSHAVFNLDQNLSKLYIGGVPDNAMIQSTIPHKRFEGCIEDLEFEDTPIGLWNFAEGNNNNEGCVERDKLVEFKPSTGLRFDGSGYSILNRRSADKFQKRVEVVLHFRTYASNGLLFLIGKDMDFLAIELQDGKVVFHFNLGSGTAVITSPGTYNDGYWHSLQASRHKRDALLRLDGEEVGSTLAPGLLEDLAFTDEIYIGGFPGTHTFKEVTNVGFEGCIDNVQIGTTLIDLNKNKEALGIVPGCPTPVARIISFQPYSTGYVAMPNVKDVQTSAQFTLKFKTSASEGLLLYTTNTDNSNYLSLSLLDGVIVFKSNLKGEVRTASTKYNDEEWHYITATREYDEMRLDIDDYEVFQAQDSVERGHIFLDSFIYIGGVPSNVRIPPRNTASSKPLVGCIGDVTFNGLFQNFANTTDRKGGSLASCPIADPSPSPPSFSTDIPTYPTVDFDYEQQETTTKKKKSTPRPKPPPRIRTTTSIITTTTTAVPPLENQCRYSLRPAGDPDLTELSGLRFGTNNRSRLEYLIKKDDFRSSTNVSLEFKANSPDGILFYISEGQLGDFVSLYLQNGQIHMAYNLGSGSTMINSERKYDDGNWHSVVVGRNFNRAMFNVDGTIVRATSDQTSVTMVPNNPFYIGGLSDEASFSAKRHLKIVAPLNGCIRNIILPSSHERPVEHFVQPCSNKVEAGSFISVDGGYLIPYDHFRVGLDFETNLEIKPRSISGVLMSVHGKRGDYLVLQLIDGAIKFSVDNGAGAITATYYPPNRHYFCDGQWHKIQAVKAKNVVTLSVDDIFVEPGIGTAGVSSTDTYDPLYIGGVPRPSRVKGVETTDQFVGCIRDMIVNQQQAPLSNARVIGNATLNVCPTI